jgi:hypothetical protein
MVNFAPGAGAQTYPYRQQGVSDDITSAVSAVAVPIVASLLSAGQPQQGFRSQGVGLPQQQQAGTYQQQSFWDDVGNITRVALPIITSLLSAGPQNLQQQGLQQQGLQQQGSFRAQGAGWPQQQQAGSYQPQGFWDDIGNITRVAVPIITSLLAAGPPHLQQQGLQQQGLFRAQGVGLPQQQQAGTYQQQSFWDDIGNITRVAVPIITALLSAGPPGMQGGVAGAGQQNVYAGTNPQVNAAIQTLLASLQAQQQQGAAQQQPQTVPAGAR